MVYDSTNLPSDQTKSEIGENRNEWDLIAQEKSVQLILHTLQVMD